MPDDFTRERELLQICLQDLASGKDQFGQLLTDLPAKCEAPSLSQQIEAQAKENAAQRRRFDSTGFDLDGPENIWMKGIVDDARRDVDTNDRGWSRDVSLIGALRKAFAAEIVSTETALAIAQRIGDDRAMRALARNHGEEAAACAVLGRLLGALTAEDRR